MQAVNCPRCGRIFTKIRASVCPTCEKEDEVTFEKVREYVKENPDRSIQMVSEETEVPVKRILKFIRDGRLEVSQGISLDVRCSTCGKPISTGRFCDKCAHEIKKSMLKQSQAQQDGKSDTKSSKSKRMHIDR